MRKDVRLVLVALAAHAGIGCSGSPLTVTDAGPSSGSSGSSAGSGGEGSGFATSGSGSSGAGSSGSGTSGAGSSSGSGTSGAGSSSGSGTSGGTEPVGDGMCSSTKDCVADDICGFPRVPVCGTKGICFHAPQVSCQLYSPGCACDGTEINIACTGLPTGYDTKPLRQTGVCKDGG
jgi:hypothetical protein